MFKTLDLTLKVRVRFSSPGRQGPTTFYSARNTPSGSISVPWLNLRGRWLDAAGFHVNTPMRIHVMPGCLVLVADDSDSGDGRQSKAAKQAAKEESSQIFIS